MKFEIKSWKDKKYIEYSDEEKGLTFNNAEYFVFDVLSEEFKNIMCQTGGFVANMTTRHIKKMQLDVSRIMLCCIPQEYNNFLFDFVYLDKDNNILDSMSDNNYFDYAYFKEKFKDCIVKEGFIYELENIESLHDLTKKFHPSLSINFDLEVDGKKVCYEDTLICHDFSIFKDNIRANLERLNAKYILLSFDCNHLNFIALKGRIIGEDGNPVLCYQAWYGEKDKGECLKTLQKNKNEGYAEKDICDDEFDFDLDLNTAKAISDKLHFFQDEKETFVALEEPDI